MNSVNKLILKIIILTVVNFIAGYMGAKLALPPGFATSIWPPAGIALAAVLVFGLEVWPGIFISAFFIGVNAQMSEHVSFMQAVFGGPAFFQAVGSTLQAIFGHYLIRRYVGYPRLLNEEKGIVKFLILGGPVSCVVAATIAVSALCGFGAIPWSSFYYTWGTWWVGDSIGVMIVTPLSLFLLSEPRQIFSAKHFSILIPSFLVFSVSIYMYVKVSQWEQEKIESELFSKTTYISSEINERMETYVEVLRSIEGLFASSVSVEEDEFRQFVSGPLQRYPGLFALSWDLRIKDKDKDKILLGLKKAGQVISLKEMSSDGKVIPARPMKEYMVPIYIEPEEKNRQALGFNLYSDENRKKAINAAIELGQPIVTDRLHLVQQPENEFGLLIMVPIYGKKGSIATVQDRKENAIGVVVGVLLLEDFIKSILSELSLSGINFSIEDTSAPEGKKELFKTENYKSEVSSLRDLRWTQEVTFANRVWKINFYKSYAALMEKRPWQAWFVLAAGLLFTGLFTAFLLVIIGRTSRIEDLVNKRTKELEEARVNMVSASKMSALGEMAGGMAHEINTPLTIINLKVAQIQMRLSAENIHDEKIDDGLNKIEETVARIAKIIKGLRYFARNTKNDPFEKVQVKTILEDTLYLCSERFRHNGIVLNIQNLPADLYIDCRATEISQVILNLLNNACDAVMGLTDRWVDIQLVKKDKNLEIRITDSGAGISDEVKEKIMQPFFTTKPVGKGTGLGLSISKGIVESHGGTLTIDGSVKNTCFVVTLPLHHEQSS